MAFKSKLDYTKLKSVLSVLSLRAPFTYQNLQITDVLLDAESKNLFFTTQHGSPNAVSVSISEATAFALEKGIADAATITEVYASAFITSRAETLSVAESAVVTPELNKSETTTLTDSSPVFDTGKSLTDTPIVTESLASAFAKALADSPSLSELYTSNFGKALTDTSTISESFARTATFERVFTDATSLDDTASASDDLATESGINKNNIVSVTESLNISDFNKGLTDTASIAESLAKTVSFQRTFSDTPTIGEAFAYALALETIANNVSVSESINIQLTSGANSVFNASPLNTYTINS